MPTRRTFLGSATLALLPEGLHPRLAGAEEATLAPFDDLMTAFLTEHQAPGGSLAVARRGKLVYARGFGLADAGRKRPVRADSLFRVASVSKPLTAVAVLQLVGRGRVNLDDPVLKYVGLEPHLEPGAEVDPRWATVTVRQCLHHTGGWDRDKSGDPIGVPRVIAAALKTKPPVPPADVIRYMMGRPLDFAPGGRFAYSNLGYLLLGRVVETASGEGYEAYVRKHVLAPLGVTRPRLGRALPEDRAAGEVRYHDAKLATGPCLYPPRAGDRVPVPDGAMNFEGFEAHGAWVASAVDLVKFATAFDDPKTCPILRPAQIETMWERPVGLAETDAKGKPKAVYYGCGWNVRPGTTAGAVGPPTVWHGGLIPGTSAMLVRRHDGLTWAVLFNSDRDAAGEALSTAIDPLVHHAAAAVKAWPAVDLFGQFLGGQ